jgi:predicted RNA-binding Zn ribbon-like protein
MSSWIDRSLPWLGVFPLAVDLSNTVVITRSGPLDLLVTDEELGTWIEAERARHPVVVGTHGHLNEVRRLRETVRSLLFAAAEARPLPADARGVINEMSSRSARFPILDEGGAIGMQDASNDEFTEFCGSVARSVIGILGGEEKERLSVCGAPSCGMLFIAASERQNWCSRACGNRARVARHAARSRKQSRPRAETARR